MAANWRRHSNIQSFLNSTTPFVPKSCFQDPHTVWRPANGKDMAEYFTLGDLWDRYNEWSVYGAGVPIHLQNGETVIQYYVPSLSAIQIYTNKAIASPRNSAEDTESEYSSDDSESERLSKSWDAASEDSGCDHDSLCLVKEQSGDLYFQFVERCSPYGRIPLVNKVQELAQSYPGLTSYKSLELSPTSWMSIAWYPIYHIPARRNVKELSACFLTYHTISPSFQDSMPAGIEKEVNHVEGVRKERKSKETSNCISLAPFGLATYKMLGNLWINPETGDQEKIINLRSAADSWLKQLRVQHHDFNFFSARSMW